MEALTQNIQDYLKTIYELTSRGEKASTNSLAKRLGISAPSITGMLQKLSGLQPPLVRYQKHQGAMLTEAGEKAALEVLRHHRLLEAWLVESMGYTWDAVHDEACKMEHVISEEFERRIAASLGHPLRDPHGAPIPSADLVMPTTSDLPLNHLKIGDHAIVRRVNCEDGAFLRHVQHLGLVPGAKLIVLDISPFDGTMKIQVAGREQAVIGEAVSNQIHVEVEDIEET